MSQLLNTCDQCTIRLRSVNQLESKEIPVNPEPRVQSNDLWSLGEHRLWCGKSEQNIEPQLFGSEKPSLLILDPPSHSFEHDPIFDAPYSVELPHKRNYEALMTMITWFMDEFTRKGEIIADPFAGLGTSIIAAQRLERRCYAVDHSSVRCDVIIKRWENFTGQEAKLVVK